jgi:hypothetical protein
MKTIQRYTPVLIAAGGTASGGWAGIGSFICKTTGTITVTDGNGATVIDAFPVTQGNVYEFNIYLQGRKGTVALTTAAGTLTVA